MKYYIDNLDKFIAQNNAEFTGDEVPGVLLDNFVLACEDGYAFVYEHATTTWTNEYVYEWADYGDESKVNQLWNEWDSFVRRAMIQEEEEAERYRLLYGGKDVIDPDDFRANAF